MATLTTEWQVLTDNQLAGGMFLQIIARYTGQSVDNNCSYVEAQLRIRMGNASHHCYTHSCNFTGGVFNASDTKGSYYHGWEANTTTTILTQNLTIYHNQDGDAAFTIGGYFSSNAGVRGSTSSVDCWLPHINRLSEFSVDKPTFNIGDTLTFSTTKYVSGYRNDLYMVVGNTEVFLKSNVGSTEQIDTSQYAATLYQQIPNDRTYSNIFKLYTINGNSVLGYTQQNYTAVTSNSSPTYNVAYQDTNSATIAVTGNNQQIIQNKSSLQINITNASVKNYAGGLVSASVTINNQTTTIALSGTTNVNGNINVGAVNLSQNTTALVRVTDSRGNYLEKTITLIVLPYATPSAEVFLQRKLNYYTQTDIKVTSTYSSLDSKNTISIVYRKKKTSDGDSGWSSYDTLTDDTLATFNADNTYAWNIQILIQDALEPRVIDKVLPAGQPPLYVDFFNNSVGINCFPSKNNSLEVNGNDISNTYYFDETPVGTWVDGKTLYRKVFLITSQDTYHNISNLEYTKIVSAMVYDNNYYGWRDVSSDIIFQSIKFWLTGNALSLVSNGIKLIVEYTKTN